MKFPQIHVSRDSRRRTFIGSLHDGTVVSTLKYRMDGASTVEFYHSETETAYRGLGYARIVVDFALEWARVKYLTVIPSCSFVASRMKS